MHAAFLGVRRDVSPVIRSVSSGGSCFGLSLGVQQGIFLQSVATPPHPSHRPFDADTFIGEHVRCPPPMAFRLGMMLSLETIQLLGSDGHLGC